MYVNKLHINIEKCCFIHFKPSNMENAVTAEFDVKIGDEIIKQVSETKFLGITIDNKLSWDTHINNLSKKLSCATGILNRIKYNLPSELHKNLYHTLFDSLNHTLLMALLHRVVFQTKNYSIFSWSRKDV